MTTTLCPFFPDRVLRRNRDIQKGTARLPRRGLQRHPGNRQGIPGPPHDYREGGSSRLDSVHLFPPLRELPEDPEARVDKDNNDNTLSLIAQEVGHRWSAFVWFRDRDRGGVPSSALLGRDRSHWNFFLETGGSPLEGNEWKKDKYGKDGALISARAGGVPTSGSTSI